MQLARHSQPIRRSGSGRPLPGAIAGNQVDVIDLPAAAGDRVHRQVEHPLQIDGPVVGVAGGTAQQRLPRLGERQPQRRSVARSRGRTDQRSCGCACRSTAAAVSARPSLTSSTLAATAGVEKGQPARQDRVGVRRLVRGQQQQAQRLIGDRWQLRGGGHGHRGRECGHGDSSGRSCSPPERSVLRLHSSKPTPSTCRASAATSGGMTR